MIDKKRLETIFIKHGYTDYVWIQTEDIVISQWSRLKCMFGCGSYGMNASCPPHIPSVDECRRFFDEYSDCVIFHFQENIDDIDRYEEWSRKVNMNLLKLEQDVFIFGYQKVFLLFIDECEICAECAGIRANCKVPRNARPSTEGMGIDVYSTVRKFGFPIEVLKDYSETMNRYAFLMIE